MADEVKLRGDGADGLFRSLPIEPMNVDAAGRRWVIEAVRDQDRLLQASEGFDIFPFGLLLWESAIALADELALRPALVQGARVLELGAGVGLAGMAAAFLGGAVTQTDHDPCALALSRRNAAANGLLGIATRPGDWTAWEAGERYDLVIGADILYEATLYPAIEAVLEISLAEGGRALLTDPNRTHAPAFIERLQAAGWRVVTSMRAVAALPPCAPGETVAIRLIEVSRS